MTQFDRYSVATMTVAVRRMFGPGFFARAERGRRVIARRNINKPVQVEQVTGKTWTEAVAKAMRQFDR